MELCDLSIYNNPPTEDDFNEHDLKIVPELNVSLTDIIHPPNPKLDREEESKSKPKPKQARATRYEKSPYYESQDDEEIQRQLEIAFDGKVPE
jgi:hypothetical protein